MMLRALALLLCLQGGTALRLRPALTQQCKTALVAGVCSAQLLVAPAFGLVGPTLSEAITELDASAYPIIKALPAETFPAFSEKIANLFLGFKPDKLAKSIDLGADLFNSVPQEDMCARARVRVPQDDMCARLEPEHAQRPSTHSALARTAP